MKWTMPAFNHKEYSCFVHLYSTHLYACTVVECCEYSANSGSLHNNYNKHDTNVNMQCCCVHLLSGL